MDYLFSEAGSQALDLAAIGPTLFAFDLDALVPPGSHHLPEDTRRALQELSRYATVAVLSSLEPGTSAEDTPIKDSPADRAWGAGRAAGTRPAADGTADTRPFDVFDTAPRPGSLRPVPGEPIPLRRAQEPRSRQEAVNQVLAACGCRKAVFVGAGGDSQSLFATAPSHWLTVQVGTAAVSPARWFVNDSLELTSLLRAIVARRRH